MQINKLDGNTVGVTDFAPIFQERKQDEVLYLIYSSKIRPSIYYLIHFVCTLMVHTKAKKAQIHHFALI